MFKIRRRAVTTAQQIGSSTLAVLTLLTVTAASAQAGPGGIPGPPAGTPAPATAGPPAGKPAPPAAGKKAAPASAAAAPVGCPGASVIPSNPAMAAAAAGTVLCLINEVRRGRGLPAVLASPLLNKAAATHASDMVRRKYFDHVSPSGADLRKRVARTGYLRGARKPTLGETLAWGSDLYAAPSGLVSDLMASASHKAIIVDRRFRDIGVGLVLGAPMDGMGSGATLTLNFGRR